MRTLIVGASNKKIRYSYKALKSLQKKGFEVVLLHPKLKEIDGIPVYNNFSEIKNKIHTVTLYVNKKVSQKMEEDIIKLNPKRVIFNPGTENDNLKNKAIQKGITPVYACTLIMLSTGQY